MLENENKTQDEVVDSVPFNAEDIGNSGPTESTIFAETVRVTSSNGSGIGFSIASLVCGIASIICCCFVGFSFLLSAAGLALGIISCCKNYDGKGMAIAGIVLSGIGLVLSAIGGMFIFITSLFSNANIYTYKHF